MNTSRWLAIGLAVVALTFNSGAQAFAADGAAARMVPLRPFDGKAHTATTGSGQNLLSHGGSVETIPAVYISWWGTEWSTVSGPTGHTNVDARSYLAGFFGNVGGSSWINSTSQYCQGVASGTTTCLSSVGRITNPSGQLKGSFFDLTSVPKSPSQTDIAAAAVRLMTNFGYNANATYFVFTPSGKSMSGFGTSFCAWHSSTSTTAGNLAYAYIPYQPDAGSACGMNFVNTTTGYFDGFSIVGGHEYAEAQTDPFPSSGWLDRRGAENADKCAWILPGQPGGAIDILGSYAVQSLWSNKTSSCVTTYP